MRLQLARRSSALLHGAVAALLWFGCSEPKTDVVSERPARASKVETDAGPSALYFDDIGEAVAAVLRDERPRIVGFGEAHQQRHTSSVRSSLARFTKQVVPVLASHRASHMVLETWVEKPQCGPAQKKVDGQVRHEMQRPATTKSELSQLLSAAADKGIGRHGIAMNCEEYESLLGDAGTVDYAQLLSLITVKLRDKAALAVKKSESDTMVFIYGGALHNDLYPNTGVEQWSYAAAIDREVAGRYVEIDVLVPEYIDGDPVLSKEKWFSAVGDRELRRRVRLVRRGPRSYIVLARRGVAAKSSSPSPR